MNTYLVTNWNDWIALRSPREDNKSVESIWNELPREKKPSSVNNLMIAIHFNFIVDSNRFITFISE